MALLDDSECKESPWVETLDGSELLGNRAGQFVPAC